MNRSIILDDNDFNINISIIESKRKRYVYAMKLKYEHRQTVNILYEGHLLSLLLIDPNDTRAEITLLNMPIQTNPAVIEHIFLTMNSKWKTSGIKHAPGEQKRGDRWQLYLECDDRKTIPEGFVLSEMGPEGQDIRVKIFVSGRRVGQISEQETTKEKSQSKLPPTPLPTTTPTPQVSAPPPLSTPSPKSVPTHAMFLYDDDINSLANKRHDTSLKNVHSDAIHHRPTPSPEPDPKKLKPNDTSNSGKILSNTFDQKSVEILENYAKKLKEKGCNLHV